MSEKFLEKLLRIVGSKGLITKGDISKYLTDVSGKNLGKAIAIVLPRTAHEVSLVVRLADSFGASITPQGGNTSLCSGSIPLGNSKGLVLSLERMNKIREIDRTGQTAIVEAGCILATLHEAVDEIERQFPLYLGSEGSAQIGGLVSTNAGGIGALRYGSMKDLVFGLEVVLANGDIISELHGLRKDNRGYNFNQLFLGAEGTLGIVTAAALKLYPKLKADAHAFISVNSPSAALKLFEQTQNRFDTSLQAFELLSGSQIDIVTELVPDTSTPLDKPPEWGVLIQLGSANAKENLKEQLENFLGAEFESGHLLDAVIAQNKAQSNAFWKLRHSVGEANFKAGFAVMLDISVRVSKIPTFIAKASTLLRTAFPHAVPTTICHLGDGNIHFTAMFRKTPLNSNLDQAAAKAEIFNILSKLAIELGGSYSAEHGIGRKLVNELKLYSDPEKYKAMLAIKKIFDPKNLMNPGVIFSIDTFKNNSENLDKP